MRGEPLRKYNDAREDESKRLRDLIDRATNDSIDEGDEHSGLLSMIREEVVVPFRARLVGEDVEVIRFEWPKEGYGLNAVCKTKRGTEAKEATGQVLRGEIDQTIRNLLGPTKEEIERALSNARAASDAIRDAAIGSLQAAFNIKIIELGLDFNCYSEEGYNITANVIDRVIEGKPPLHIFSLPQNYATKKYIVRELNEVMRSWDAAIWSDKLEEPCILVASGSRDGQGRYVLQGRMSKKRVEAYKSIAELLPAKLVPDTPRKEGFIERRKSQELDETEEPKTRIVDISQLEWIEPLPQGFNWIEAYFAWRDLVG
jgi:hypothetical protein